MRGITVQEVHTHQQQKLNIWSGIFGDRVGPFYLPVNWTGEMLLQLLEEVIVLNNPVLAYIIKNDQQYEKNNLI